MHAGERIAGFIPNPGLAGGWVWASSDTTGSRGRFNSLFATGGKTRNRPVPATHSLDFLWKMHRKGSDRVDWLWFARPFEIPAHNSGESGAGRDDNPTMKKSTTRAVVQWKGSGQ